MRFFGRLLVRLGTLLLERQVARVIDRHRPTVICVTGSVGKTSTKLAIGHVLSARYRVLVDPVHVNTHLTVALSVLQVKGVRRDHSPAEWIRVLLASRESVRHYSCPVLVLELSESPPGSIPRFMRHLRPDIGIITATAPAHIRTMRSPETAAAEALVLARSSALALLNADDERLMAMREQLGSSAALTYGLRRGDMHFTALERDGSNRIGGELALPEGGMRLNTRLIGAHSLYAIEVAAFVGRIMGVDPGEIQERVSSWHPVPGRMNPLRGRRASVIIDDSFNANPTSVIAALDELHQWSGRRIAVLGSMNELGDLSAATHAAVGRQCASLDLLVTVGKEAAQHLAPAAELAGLAASRVIRCATSCEAGRHVATLLRNGDTVLVKGSQDGVYAEEAIPFLLADPADIRQLVRQGADCSERKARDLVGQNREDPGSG